MNELSRGFEPKSVPPDVKRMEQSFGGKDVLKALVKEGARIAIPVLEKLDLLTEEGLTIEDIRLRNKIETPGAQWAELPIEERTKLKAIFDDISNADDREIVDGAISEAYEKVFGGTEESHNEILKEMFEDVSLEGAVVPKESDDEEDDVDEQAA